MQIADNKSKFIIGCSLTGFTELQLEELSETLVGKKNSEFVLVLSENGEQALFKYYKAAYEIAKSGNRIIVIYMDGCVSWKPVAILLAQYNIYDVYRVTFVDSITTQFVASLEKREPSSLEQSIVHGWEVASFTDINLIITGISSLVSEGNIDGLAEFIRKNKELIDKIVPSIDYMKIKMDEYYLQKSTEKEKEALDKLKELEEELSKANKIGHKSSKEIEKQKLEIEELEEKIIELKSQIRQEKKDIKEYTSSNLRDYPELVTTQVNTRASHILYIKEIDKIPYINSLVWAIAEELKLNKIRYKLMVYDCEQSTHSQYEPLTVCDSERFISDRRNIVSKLDRIVVMEPNQVIISDILKEVPAYDVVIIYDRMRQPKDIVVGTEVVKYYVCSNLNMYNVGVKEFGIKTSEQVISLANSSIGGKFLDIPFIEDYSKCTTNAKISKYMKLIGSRTGKNVAKEIFEKCGIEKLIKN